MAVTRAGLRGCHWNRISSNFSEAALSAEAISFVSAGFAGKAEPEFSGLISFSS
jgi:hypothetical protein